MSLVPRYYAWLFTYVVSAMDAFASAPRLKVPWMRGMVAGRRLWYVSSFGTLGFMFAVMGIVLHGWVRVASLCFSGIYRSDFIGFDWVVPMSWVFRFYARLIAFIASDMDTSAFVLGLKVPGMRWWRCAGASGTCATAAWWPSWLGSEWRVGGPY